VSSIKSETLRGLPQPADTVRAPRLRGRPLSFFHDPVVILARRDDPGQRSDEMISNKQNRIGPWESGGQIPCAAFSGPFLCGFIMDSPCYQSPDAPVMAAMNATLPRP